MRSIALPICAALSLVAIPAWAGGFRLVFEDQFDGNELDREKWATRYVYKDGTLATLNDELEDYADLENHVVENGTLSLVARRKPGSDRYHSGVIRSRQTFYYGYFEARVFLPNAKGIFPAFWINSDHDADGRLEWPPEIDAFEYVINETNETPDMIHSGLLLGKKGLRGGKWLYRDPNFDERWTYFRAPKPLNTSWQVVGMLWRPDTVTVYLNGKKLYEREYRWVYDDGQLAGPAHVLLNLAVGGKWAGLNGVDHGKFPQSLRIDYVRVCQYDPASTSTARCGGNPMAPSPSEGAYSTPLPDLKRTRLVSAELAKSAVAPGESVSIKYVFDGVPTRTIHAVRTTLVSASGKDVVVLAEAPPVPTTAWQGIQTVTHSLQVPAGTPAGTYEVRVGIGKEKVPGSKLPRRVPLALSEQFGVPDGRQRLRVGELTVRSVDQRP